MLMYFWGLNKLKIRQLNDRVLNLVNCIFLVIPLCFTTKISIPFSKKDKKKQKSFIYK